MSFEETIRQIIREENEKHLEDIKCLLNSNGHQEIPKMLTVEQAAKILDFGLNKTYELIHQAEHTRFPFIRDGRKIRIPYSALMNWIDQQAKQAI
ncbi:helix-turn-helix domain-containing protein [Oceanobacillus sp. CF4.6]|uniref:helix-turn-helix domain-containing protein n=1 Tax=Oceanobacillus sp. CF4.6 TaxID=3373080 RepID=UPI003EE5DA2B